MYVVAFQKTTEMKENIQILVRWIFFSSLVRNNDIDFKYIACTMEEKKNCLSLVDMHFQQEKDLFLLS